MPLTSSAKSGGGGFEPVPAGTHIARCVTVVDLGWQDSPWGEKQQVYLAFEVPGVRVEWEKDDQKHEGPALIGVTWTNNIYEEANLGKNLISWRGRPFTDDEKDNFDLFKVLDVPAMISVTHKTKGDKTYANIGSIMGVPKGTQAPDRETPLLSYSLEDPKTHDALDRMPEWLLNKCIAGQQTEPPMQTDKPPREPTAMPEGMGPDDFDDDIPF